MDLLPSVPPLMLVTNTMIRRNSSKMSTSQSRRSCLWSILAICSSMVGTLTRPICSMLARDHTFWSLIWLTSWNLNSPRLSHYLQLSIRTSSQQIRLIEWTTFSKAPTLSAFRRSERTFKIWNKKLTKSLCSGLLTQKWWCSQKCRTSVSSSRWSRETRTCLHLFSTALQPSRNRSYIWMDLHRTRSIPESWPTPKKRALSSQEATSKVDKLDSRQLWVISSSDLESDSLP